MGYLDDLREASGETLPEFYPGSRKPLVRHPNRHHDAEERPDPDRWDAKPQVHKIAGEATELFTVGQLAQALGRRPVTIRTWERNKTLPNATVQLPGRNQDVRGRRRLYTRAQIEGLVKIAQEEGLLNGDRRSIRATDFTRRSFDLFRGLAVS